MGLRRKLGLIVPLGLALTMARLDGRGTAREAQAAQPVPTVETRPEDWTVQVTPTGMFVLAHKGMPVVTNLIVFWGPKWAWAGCDLKNVPEEDGKIRFVGTVPGLHMKMVGEVDSPAPNETRMDLLVRTEQEMPEVVGGGWEWDFKLDSPSFGGKLPDPELLPDGGGWTWRVAGDRAMTLRVEGAAKVYFERGRKGAVRTFLAADRIEPGTRPVRFTLSVPAGARRIPSPEERYDRPDLGSWFPAALAPDAAPVDLSFLNRDDRPAGRRGFVRADGDRLVFGDGSPARFWGANLAAGALFTTPRQEVVRQARRMARLGYNLMRLHHHDSSWVAPNIFGTSATGSRQLDRRSLEAIDWWIKCLKDEGIYVWLDMHVGRVVKPGDGITVGTDEIARQHGLIKAFCYYNTQVQELMKEFQHQFLGHLNPHTNLRYQDDPAVMGVLITNENDLTHHGGNLFLPDKNNPVHNAIWTRGYKAFADRFGLPQGRVFQTWLGGPSKLYLAQAEHEFNETMIADLRGLGVRAPIATTNFWGNDPSYAIPPLTDGDIIDVHTYGQGEELGRNARYQGNFADWIAIAQVYGKPLSVTEWNVEYPTDDRFTGPLFVASLAALQGWDAPMIYTYSQTGFGPAPGPEKWSTYHDPSLTALMPAAALLFRRGHVAPAQKTYCFIPDPETLFTRGYNPDSSATVRTLAEQSKLTLGMPVIRELPWLKPTKPAEGVIVVTDPDHDFIPEGQSFVRSDTGELTRNWELGIQSVDSPRTQSVAGWIGGQKLTTHDATFEVRTKKAAIALSSVDDRPLGESRFILVTAVARTMPSPGNRAPYLSEPVRGRVVLRTKIPDLELLAMGRDGRVVGRPAVERQGDSLSFEIPAGRGTHWYVLKAPSRPNGAGPSGAPADQPAPKRR